MNNTSVLKTATEATWRAFADGYHNGYNDKPLNHANEDTTATLDALEGTYYWYYVIGYKEGQRNAALDRKGAQ